MRILLKSGHRYPASIGGRAGQRVLDALAKGLGELGHDVYYWLEDGAAVPLPAGVRLAPGPRWDVDVMHLDRGPELFNEADDRGQPWVRTCHVDLALWSMDRSRARDNWIFVSRTLARAYGSDRYVLNGIDPAELLYSETKDDYFLFVIDDLERAGPKGLDIGLALARKMGLRLVVAGSSPDRELMSRFTARCRDHGAEHVGEVYGLRKAQVFAAAKALLFPTQLNESFGLVMVEALMSGTPVICSAHGACPEIISSDVGFVCSGMPDYERAVAQIGTISPRACRDKAMKEYHYLRLAADYVKEYEREIARRR